MLKRETVERAFQAAMNITAQGTSKSDLGYGPPFGPPWFIIDTSTAEPEVNHHGECLEVLEDVVGLGKVLMHHRINRMMQILGDN
jgi:hypothetical protein